MAFFKIATIGDTKDNVYFEVAQQLLAQGYSENDLNEIEFVDITGMTKDDIEELGPVHGVMYFSNTSQDNPDKINKDELLKTLLSLHTVPSDLKLFALSHEPVTSEEQNKEEEKIQSYIKEEFPNIKNTENLSMFLSLANIDTPEAMVAYTHGIIETAFVPDFEYIDSIESQTKQKVDKMLELVTSSLELKHPYTAGHVERVSVFAEAIAREMGCNDKEIDDIVIAAKLHDIGKLIIPDRILASSKDLDYNDRKQMDIHDKAGAQLLEALTSYDTNLTEKLSPEVLKGIKHHHKDWDGRHDKKSEIPDPIRGKKIGKYATIIAVADCIDAMVSQRAYNNPKHILDTFRDLWSNREKQFEPAAAEAAIMVLGKEIASLGYDPVKMFSEVSSNPWWGKFDLGLQNFFNANANEFKVNEHPEPGTYSSLGFRLTEQGYFEFNGKNAAQLDPEIRYESEIRFLTTHPDKIGSIPKGITLSPEEIKKAAIAQAKDKFIKQDDEGTRALDRSRVYQIEKDIHQEFSEETMSNNIRSKTDIISVEARKIAEPDIPKQVHDIQIKRNDCQNAITTTKSLREQENQRESGIGALVTSVDDR